MQKRIARGGGSVLKLLFSFVLTVGLMPSLAFAGQEGAADEAEYASEGVSLAVSDGWTQWDTLEWKVDDGGCLVLRPLGGAARGSSSKGFNFTSLSSGATSFRIEGEVSLRSLIFMGASDLREIDLTGLDTSTAAITAGHMFDGCSSLESIEFGDGFDTSNVTYMLFTFRGCSSLTSLDLSGWDTSNVTDMYHMFDGCTSLTSLDLSSFDTSKAVRMGGMFDGCSSLRSVSLGAKFSFYGSGHERQCSLPTPSGDGLTGRWVSSHGTVYTADKISGKIASTYTAETESNGWTQWDTLEWRVDDGGRFVLRPAAGAARGSSDKSLDFNNLCSGATSFRIEGEVSLRSLIFWGASDLREIDLTGLDTSTAAITAGHMFDGCSSLESIEFGDGFDTSNVTYLLFTFRGCSSLTSLDLSGWDTSNVTDMYHMFDGCTSLTSLDLSSFDTSKAVRMGGMFDGCTSLRSVSLGAKFSFCGSGTERQCSLPTPSGDGLTGRWVSSVDSAAYAADSIPNNVAASYEAQQGQLVYRLYNSITSEHLFTTNFDEYSSLTAYDWQQEGVSWNSPTAGKGVYRVYNPALGAMGKMSHHYTTDYSEAAGLVANHGWQWDNGGQPIFYSAEDESGNVLEGASPVYRLYNGGLSSHHFTLNSEENAQLIAKYGWKGEGVGFYAFSAAGSSVK